MKKNLIILISLIVFTLSSQNNNTPCTATVICPNVNIVATPTQNFQVNNPALCTRIFNRPTVFYSVVITQSGTFTFSIIPSPPIAPNPPTDYDWAVYRNIPCGNINANTIPVSLNFSGTGGTTGMSTLGAGTCQNAGGTPFNAPLNVAVGDVIIIAVNGFSNSLTSMQLIVGGANGGGGTAQYSCEDWKLGGNIIDIRDANNNLMGKKSNIIGPIDNNPFRMFTNGEERIRITETGNVGIGTTIPNSIFDVFSNSNNFKFNNGNGNQTPTISIINNSSTTGKATAFLAGTVGSALLFDNTGPFSIGTESKFNFTNNSLGGSTNLLVTILQSGNVGIGSITPQNKLEITHGSANNSGLRFTNLNNSSSSIANTTNKVLSVNTSGDVILVDDKQGITSTTNTLNLSGSTLTSTVNGVVSNSITLPSATESFWNLGGNTNITSTNNIIGITNANLNPLRFFTNNLERMTLTSNGNVGIGTTTPNSIFDVFSNSNNYKFNNGNGNQTPTISIINNSSTTGKATAFLAGTAGSALLFDDSGPFSIGTEPKFNFTNNALGGSTNLLFTILQNGNVGIGTTAPGAQLHTTGSVRFAGITQDNSFSRIMVQNSNGDVRWKDAATFGTGNTTNSCNVSGSIPRLNGTNSYTCSQLFDNGISVGINKTTGFAYTWAGGLTGSTLPSSSGTVSLDVEGVVRGLAFIATSDENSKTNIQKIENAKQLILGLNGKTYNWNEKTIQASKADNSRQYGFIAQEVAKILPEAVIVDENGKYGIQYNAIIPILVEAVKAQEIQINELKAGTKSNTVAPRSNSDFDAMNKEMNQLKAENQMFKEKFELLEKSISLLCESGCAGLEKAKQNVEDVDVLYQSIPNPTDNEALINFYLSKKYNNVSIQINSLEGKNMETIMLDGAQGKGSVKIQLGQYAAQTYFYSLIVDNKVVETKKLTVIR